MTKTRFFTAITLCILLAASFILSGCNKANEPEKPQTDTKTEEAANTPVGDKTMQEKTEVPAKTDVPAVNPAKTESEVLNTHYDLTNLKYKVMGHFEDAMVKYNAKGWRYIPKFEDDDIISLFIYATDGTIYEKTVDDPDAALTMTNEDYKKIVADSEEEGRRILGAILDEMHLQYVRVKVADRYDGFAILCTGAQANEITSKELSLYGEIGPQFEYKDGKLSVVIEGEVAVVE